MSDTSIEVPTGDALERQIASVEERAHYELKRDKIAQRVAIASDPATVFVPHEDVFTESRAHLLKRLAGAPSHSIRDARFRV